ncbi:hypothetical protein O1R50_22835 [Glycomyces luteolus]|uniref:Alpha-D-xyloside xylohydrolase n=1 Tax=Glycomyces luteolus TaxID=2670330 RepID=A0A9X3PED6_9ACTN|nr:TIM-barrel domain-containing protein [Glycomyces luteolus]MDA1362476.1 hypothetical protein [Glycomyces luteolus]
MAANVAGSAPDATPVPARTTHCVSGFQRTTDAETLRVTAWGEHAVRVQANASGIRTDLPGALILESVGPGAETEVFPDGSARIVNGRLTVELDVFGRLTFLESATGNVLLAEHRPYTWHSGPRVHHPNGDGTTRLEAHFATAEGERRYGLGQHLHGRLDQSGLVIDLVQGNTVAAIPFLYSSTGYGFLWNNPAVGRVELGGDVTRWVADAAHQIDYWVTAGSPAEALDTYTAATGRPPLVPDWATGFWQSRLRYASQEEILAVAREFARRDLPLAVIVADFMHWPHMGDWRFEESEWPGVTAMTAELRDLGTELAVSIWPTVSPLSENYAELASGGHLVRDRNGGHLTFQWPTRNPDQRPDFIQQAYYDATDPEARRILWRELKEHYWDQGVRALWLDACEPDFGTAPSWNEAANRAEYHSGPAAQVGNLYGRDHITGVAEGLRAAGEDRPLLLIRSAWAGSQRHGAALWSGDIPATWDSLRRQIPAGLNTAMSGIPWWHSDIGGFQGGDPADPAYRELMIRWFQYGTFMPVMRLHGDRVPNRPFSAHMNSGPNEPWSYGAQAYAIMADHIRLRERLRSYISELGETAHMTGTPPMRPLFFDHPDDEPAWDITDQYLFGPDLVICPITEPGRRERQVYLPAASDWVDVATGATHAGGQLIDTAAPLERLPVFARAGATIIKAFNR